MAVAAPPRPPDSTDPIDRAELEALIESLIEEARRRARRRRRRYGAAIAAVVLAAGGVYFGIDHGGGTIGSRSARAGSAGGATSATASAGGRWEPSHGPYGGSVHVVATAPSAPNVVYVGTARGVFESRNGGRSWRRAGLTVREGSLQTADPQITSLAVDPRAPATVYATRSLWTGGGLTLRQELFKSTDGGRTWRTLGLAARLVAVDPADPATVYAIVGAGWKTNRLFRSRDGGRRWQPIDRGLPSTHFSGLAFDPTAAATVYAASGLGILESADGGSSWRRGRDALSRRDVSAVAVDPRHPRTLYAGTDEGLIKSFDGGGTWRMANTVLGSHGRDRASGQVSSLVVDPLDSQTVYATARCAGIFRSTDGGRRWSAANAGRRFGCLDTSLALAASAPHALFGVYPGRGVFKSTDGGIHWRAANTGLSLTTVSSLAVDPDRPQTVYASTRELGLFESSDGGAHWRPVVRGLVDAVALDPRDPRIVLAAGPSFRVVRSTDAGRTWQPAGAGIAVTPTALAISGDHAYAATSSRGVYGSRDGGRSWRTPTSPRRGYVEALAVSPDDPAVVYAGAGGPNERGLYRSGDGGRTWQRLTDALDDTDVSAVALDPTHPTTVYIATGGDGIFKSIDGGVDWQPAGSGLPRIRLKGITATGKTAWFTSTVSIAALVIDPARPTTLYAATRGRGILRSTNAGASWRPFSSGLDPLDVRSLAIDATGRTLYAGTAGGGVVALHAGTR